MYDTNSCKIRLYIYQSSLIRCWVVCSISSYLPSRQKEILIKYIPVSVYSPPLSDPFETNTISGFRITIYNTFNLHHQRYDDKASSVWCRQPVQPEIVMVNFANSPTPLSFIKVRTRIREEISWLPNLSTELNIEFHNIRSASF